MRCPYCHNRDLVLETESLPAIPEEAVLTFLEKRRGLLDGICITGGEPTLQTDLMPFIDRARALGLRIKLDTNGTNPAVLDELIEKSTVDCIAMDIKAPGDRYEEVTRSRVSLTNIEASIRLIKESHIDYEFRTTVAPGLIAEEDLIRIGRWLAGAKKYVLQQYAPGPTLDDAFSRRHPYSGTWLKDVARKLEPFFERVEIRGISPALAV